MDTNRQFTPQMCIRDSLYHSFSPFVMCYALYGLISRKMRRRKAVMLIGLILLTQILSALALGSRGRCV